MTSRYETLKASLEASVIAAKALGNYSMAHSLQAQLKALTEAYRSHPEYSDKNL